MKSVNRSINIKATFVFWRRDVDVSFECDGAWKNCLSNDYQMVYY